MVVLIAERKKEAMKMFTHSLYIGQLKFKEFNELF